jgi:hypothetical protein
MIADTRTFIPFKGYKIINGNMKCTGTLKAGTKYFKTVHLNFSAFHVTCFFSTN